jgi:hypothetical protein
LLLIASVLVGRLLVANQAFVPAELLALLLLLPMVVLMHRLTPQPRRAALVLAVMTVLIIDGLAPFDFTTTAARFDMWPFKSWLANGVIEALRSIDWVELLGRVFLSASLVWVVKEWGASLRLAIAVVVTIVLAIEVLQMWLPDQHATITDPVITLAVGLLFRFLYERRATRLVAAGVTSHRRVRSR